MKKSFKVLNFILFFFCLIDSGLAASDAEKLEASAYQELTAGMTPEMRKQVIAELEASKQDLADYQKTKLKKKTMKSDITNEDELMFQTILKNVSQQ